MGKDGDTTSSSEYHPALGVNNIKNSILLILDREKIYRRICGNDLTLLSRTGFLVQYLETILCKGDTAQQIWDKLKAIFQNNKTTRAVYLENQFNSLHLSNSSDISSYCHELKNLKDQLANVDQTVLDQKMVIRLVSGL
ncbi:uncharacterized protein LOC110699764 [Chenopodium quinoa]|uniref:uncharacterized protein LOC110699764 n=1 Tax=Chenopodium quinoa TaxID=63459 RepID=UPI000B791097|nr:uncharacterized protein LOC110699764 [Chenopodium quinoa]